MKRHLRTAAIFLGAIILWELIAEVGPWPSYVLPGPIAVGKSLWATARSGRLFFAIWISLRRLFCGFGIAIAIGTLTGLATARWPIVRRAARPTIVGLQALPSICWLPLALLWFGLSEGAILFVVVMGSMLSIAIATEGAVLSVPPIYVRAARTLGAKRLPLYTRVIIPAALPGIVIGLRLGWTFAWRSLMAGELLYVAGGLGQLLTVGRELDDMPLVVAVMGVIIAIGLLFERIAFGALERHVRERWGY
jgi:NitT/TauT family transport system permease protein